MTTHLSSGYPNCSSRQCVIYHIKTKTNGANKVNNSKLEIPEIDCEDVSNHQEGNQNYFRVILERDNTDYQR